MIPVYKPSIKRKEMDALLSTLVSDYQEVANDNNVFLKELSKILRFEPGALLRDYSTAIFISLQTLGLGFRLHCVLLVGRLLFSVQLRLKGGYRSVTSKDA